MAMQELPNIRESVRLDLTAILATLSGKMMYPPQRMYPGGRLRLAKRSKHMVKMYVV